MYQLHVMHAGSTRPTERVSLRRASDVLEAIPRLLARHGDCVRVDVLCDDVRLFAVDCDGNRLPG